MIHNDGRRAGAKGQELIRMKAIRMVNSGMTQKKVGECLGVSRQAVNGWCKTYNEGGFSALKMKQRGFSKGLRRQLSIEQSREIRKMITDKTPDQLKLTFALWNRLAVKELIQDQYGVNLCLSQVGNYLREWGFTPQKPIKKAYEQSPVKVNEWLDEEYPQIKEQAKKENAEIFWGDETAVRSDCQHLRGYAPKGQTPVLKKSGKRFKTNMISAINNQGKLGFMIYKEKMDADMFIRFLQQLIKGRRRKLYLILDNLKVHHSNKVKDWVKEHSEKIELFFIPSYSPELNPDEYLNCDLKANVHRRSMPRNEEKLMDNLEDFMFDLRFDPERIKSYFRHPKIQYAAA